MSYLKYMWKESSVFRVSVSRPGERAGEKIGQGPEGDPDLSLSELLKRPLTSGQGNPDSGIEHPPSPLGYSPP